MTREAKCLVVGSVVCGGLLTYGMTTHVLADWDCPPWLLKAAFVGTTTGLCAIAIALMVAAMPGGRNMKFSPSRIEWVFIVLIVLLVWAILTPALGSIRTTTPSRDEPGENKEPSGQ